MRLLILVLPVMLAAGCADYSHPVTPKVLAALSPQQATELQVWSTNHPVIWDLRFHRPATCPFGYTIGYPFRVNSTGWPQWLHEFYYQKHLEQDNCTCDEQLAGKTSRGS